jgi:hypothetical protein
MLLTDQDYQVRLDRIKEIKIHLDPDPVSIGLASLNAKISETQAQKDNVNSMFVEAIHNRAEAKIVFESRNTELEMQINSLLATDNDVKAQKTGELRSALASTKCADLELKKHHAELDFIRADSYCNIAQQVYKNIESAFESLSRQITVIQMGVELGEIRRDDLGTNKYTPQQGKQITIT